MTIEEHGHRRLPATGFETRTVQVDPSTGAVSYPVPTYDEQVTLGCPICMEVGARAERERITEALMTLSTHEIPNGYVDREDVLSLLSGEEGSQEG